MIGNSFCYYYAEELCGMLIAAGYNNVNICNVYYSGCSLEKHWQWWKNGEAWKFVREGGYDNLCSRLSVNAGEGDYYHDGDIGGGQYLNACVWFEAITGQSCIGNTYRPDYALDESLIPTLQTAAHKAIEQRKLEDNK